MIDKYLLGLRQKEYRERKEQERLNNIWRSNKAIMSAVSEPVEYEESKQITFNLDKRRKKKWDIAD